MTPERWQQVEKVYHSALELAENERPAFLEKACAGDRALRQEVESLLDHQKQTKKFFEAPALVMAAQGQPAQDDARSWAGQQMGSYKILSLLGSGGMGEVYLARDSRLDRTVALKILPAQAASDQDRMRRFIREARAASALKHPNVTHIYEIGESEGIHFIAMEYVEGKTLAARISGRPLEAAEIVEIGLQVADALDDAHSKGITHRDIKPANLMLTRRGEVKVLDFGLAKMTHPEGQNVSSDLSTVVSTATGMVMGTVQYMSPEQMLGQEVDQRTDIFSLGVVLYEMATGTLPFKGDTGTALSDAILHKQPTAPGRVNPELPIDLERIILRALEKDRELRYQTAADVRIDLQRLKREINFARVAVSPEALQTKGRLPRWWPLAAVGTLLALLVVLATLNVGGWRDRLWPRAAPGAIESLAVLPLENLSRDPEQEYFAEGMTDELITSLAKISALRVISRTSVMRYKGTNKPLPEIARGLDVDGIIEGSTLRADGRVRITAKLIQAKTERLLWANSYERHQRDVLALQGEVAQAIANEIKVKLTPQEQARLSSTHPLNPEAYEAYLKGRYEWNRRTEEGLRKSLEYFHQAIAAEPSYAAAYSGLADSYSMLWDNGFLGSDECIPKARAAALKAIEIDDNLAEAHVSLAMVMGSYDWNWTAAEKEYRRAIELNPNYATAHHWYAGHLAQMGHHVEALEEIRKARQLDPLSPRINAVVGLHLYWARQYDLALEELNKALELNRNDPLTHNILGVVYLQKGKNREAIAELLRANQLIGEKGLPLLDLAYAYAFVGERDEARKMLEKLERQAKRTYVSPTGIGLIYAVLGERQQAFAWLERAYEQRDYSLLELKVDPIFDPLRSDPRFQDLLRRVGLPP
jgi:serine/threonine protein kinase/tetratricopeptide (TPR) repeat protein